MQGNPAITKYIMLVIIYSDLQYTYSLDLMHIDQYGDQYQCYNYDNSS